MTNRERLIEDLMAIGNSADPEDMREYERVAIEAYQYIMQLEQSLEEAKKDVTALGWQIEYNGVMGMGR